MLKFWRHKGLVVVGALTIFLSMGAVAWAATDGQSGSTQVAQVAVSTATTGATATGDQSQVTGRRPGAALREAAKDRRQQRLERQQALMNALRGDMTPADQAAYDQLVAQAKAQREALQQARQDLAGTLKELRALTDKYLDLSGNNSGG
jgi:hypothetical protein